MSGKNGDEMIKYCCGHCGKPINEDGTDADLVDGYDPGNYEKSVCQSCQDEINEDAFWDNYEE